ncbi:hypothetical protein ACKVWC_006545 [Pyricularia oryzae]
MPRFEDIKGDLFEAIWRATAPTFGPEQQSAVMTHLKAKGIEMTWDAVRQHLQKLKKKDPNGPGAATPSTPKGKKTAASATGSAAKSTSKRGRKPAKKVLDADDDEEDDFDASPSKKTKTEDKAENDAKVDRVKAEHVEEDDAI